MAAKRSRKSEGSLRSARRWMKARQERERASRDRRLGQEWVAKVARRVREASETQPLYRAFVREDDLATATAFYRHGADLIERDAASGFERHLAMLEELGLAENKADCRLN